MKKLILFLVLSFLQSKEVLSYDIIFDEPVYKISKFFGVERINSNQKDLYVQIGNYYTNSINDSYKIYKYINASNSWYNPYNGFFNPKWVFDPNFSNWLVNPVRSLEIYNIDTNVILKYYYIFEIDLLYDLVQLTHNSGGNVYPANPLAGNYSIGGFDIDSTGINISYPLIVNYYVGLSFFSNSKVIYVTSHNGSLDYENRATVPDVLPANQGGLLKINPSIRSNIFLNANTLMLSTNSGYNFFSVNIPPVKKIFFSENNLIYAFTNSKLYKSKNSGISFDSLAVPPDLNIIEVDPDNLNRLYAGTEHGVYISHNAGASWDLYFNAFISSRDVKGISKNKNSGDTIFVANDYSVYKIWNSLLDVNQNSSIVNDFKLHQNYPNPFNPVTNIKFSIPSTQYTILKVFDITGREIATLVNEKLKAGSYEFMFDAAKLSSGVYFYQLKVDDFIQTKKMLVIK